MKPETKKKAGVAALIAGVIATIVAVTRGKAAPPPPPPELASLWGIVTDAGTGSPIQAIEVFLDSWVVSTGPDGRYEFLEVEPGVYELVFTDPLGRYETLVYEE